MWEIYGDRVEFVWVYIREAHPEDGNQVNANVEEGIRLNAPKTIEEREDYAHQAAEYLNLHLTTVIDSMDDYAEGLYGGWPLRLYLIGTDGNVVYMGNRGPSGYYPPRLEEEIRSYTGLDGVTSTSAASYRATHAAPGSLASLFGPALATVTESATSTDLPLTLGGVTVYITTSLGAEHLARLFAVTPTQVNYEIPGNLEPGRAVVTLRRIDGSEVSGPLLVKLASPGLFSANMSGTGIAAAHAVHVTADGAQQWEDVARWDAAAGEFQGVPVEFRAGDDAVILVLYGTGLARASDVAVTVGRREGVVQWFGSHPVYPGLDQVNILLPSELAGTGRQSVVLTADGETANTVQVLF